MAAPEICFVYFHVGGLWNPRQVREDFADMRACGADWIFTQFHEDNPRKTLKFKVDLAHEAGLKVLASPGRVAGLFAAGPRPCSVFTIENPDALCREKDGSPLLANSSLVACVNHPKFEAWFYPAMADIIQATGADGIVFDEPKEAHKPCYCEHCKARVAQPTDQALLALKESSMAAMMGRLCARLKKDNPAGVGVAMLMPSAADGFVDRVLEQGAIDYVGSDGPMCPQGRPGPDGGPGAGQKTPLAQSAARLIPRTRKAGRRTFGLVETFGVCRWAHDRLRENLRALPSLGLDMPAFNYYGHNVEDPEGIMAIIRQAVASLKT